VNRRARVRATAVVLASVLVLALAGGLLAGIEQATQDDSPSSTAPLETSPAPRRYSDLPVILVADLPHQALETIALIAEGGPFPYERDGATFSNREGLLPAQPEGYYQVFTVPTPGEDDRGTRRIVTGGQGEVFYTADQESFSEVVSR
jgi:ribonuclease T1